MSSRTTRKARAVKARASIASRHARKKAARLACEDVRIVALILRMRIPRDTVRMVIGVRVADALRRALPAVEPYKVGGLGIIPGRIGCFQDGMQFVVNSILPPLGILAKRARGSVFDCNPAVI